MEYEMTLQRTDTPEAPTLTIMRDPARVIAEATKIADSLAAVVEKSQLYKDIGGSRHLYVEAWQTCAWFFDAGGEIVDIEEVRDQAGQWIGARAHAVTLRGGLKIGGATGLCTRDEGNWESAERFQIESMAQTRAIAKTLRNNFAWIVVLAGFAATPAEEMDGASVADPVGPKCPVHPNRKSKQKTWKGALVWFCTGKTSGGAWC